MTRYAELLAAAQADPAGADFHALRMAYAQSTQYRPYTQQKGLIAALDGALRAADLDAALDATTALLNASYLDIEAHMAAAYVYTLREDIERAAHHQAFANGLIRAILDTGTGRDPDGAFIVLDIPEEYTVMRILGLEPSGQTLVNHQGQWLDRIDVRQRGADPGATPLQIFFNVDLPRGWLGRRMDTHHAAAQGEDTP